MPADPLRPSAPQDTAARALADSEARFRALSESSPLGVFYADASGGCVYTNDRWQALTGLSAARSLGRGWASAVHPEERPTVLAHWVKAAQARRDFDMEFRLLRPEGSVRPVHAHARAVLDASGTLTGFVGTMQDVSEHHAMLARLATEQRRLRDLYEATPAMLHSIDAQGRLLMVSDTWLARLGHRRCEVIGHAVVDFLSADSRARAVAVGLPEFFKTGRCDAVPYQMLAKDGKVIDVLISSRLERDEHSAPLRSLAVLEDVTLRLRAEHELGQEHERLAHIIAATDAGTWEWNVQTGEMRLNERSAAMLGFTAPEMAGRSVHSRVERTHPDDRAHAVEQYQRHLGGHSPRYQSETRVRHRNGHWVWVATHGRIMTRTPDGKPEWMFGTQHDISERMAERLALNEANERVALATDSGGIGIFDWNIATGTLRCDAWIHRLYELPAGQPALSFAQWLQHLHPDDRAGTQRCIAAAVKGSADFDTEFRIVLGDGRVRHLRATARVTRDAQGRALCMVGANWDVTEARQLARDLAAQHELLHVTLQSIADAVITTDAQGRVLWLNPVAERLTGWSNGPARGGALSEVFNIVDEHSRQALADPVAACLRQGQAVAVAQPAVLIARTGQEVGIDANAAPIAQAQGQVLGVVLVFRDVTEHRRLTNEMRHRASHDALTGLVNRSEFETRLQRLLSRAHEDGSQHALLFVDLDQFKRVNDACGHAAGDQLLRQVSKLLAEAVRSRDTLGRLGGDEFAVLLEHCNAEQAQRVAQQICERLEVFRFGHEGRHFRIGASIGLVPLDRRWPHPGAAMQAADTACYAAKAAGRNRVHTWLETDQALHARQGSWQWANRIEQALDEHRFVLYAQRICPLGAPGTGVRAEVLLRLRDSDGSLVLPEAFLPAAERQELCTRIDRWVLSQALSWLQGLPEPGLIECLSINLSGPSLADRGFHEWAATALVQAGPGLRGKLCFDLNEAMASAHLTDAGQFINRVREQGARVALDDFGAAACSFNLLKLLAVDQLKIDGSFCHDPAANPLDAAALRCFVDVARIQGLETVAECVERPAALEHLRAIGVGFAQGRLLHAPQPITELLALQPA